MSMMLSTCLPRALMDMMTMAGASAVPARNRAVYAVSRSVGPARRWNLPGRLPEFPQRGYFAAGKAMRTTVPPLAGASISIVPP
jgi:hypothetical protein